MSDDYKELIENRPHLAELFASKGWEILTKWTAAQVAAKFEQAIRGETSDLREEARVRGLEMERFIQLATFLAEQAGLNNANEAPEQSAPATSEAQ